MKKKISKIVTGKKTFTGDIKLGADSTTTGLYASTDRKSENILSGFGDLLIDGVDQTVLKSTVFDGLLTVENLDCPNIVLNGIEFKTLLTTTGDQEVYGNVIFKDLPHGQGRRGHYLNIDKGCHVGYQIKAYKQENTVHYFNLTFDLCSRC